MGFSFTLNCVFALLWLFTLYFKSFPRFFFSFQKKDCNSTIMFTMPLFGIEFALTKKKKAIACCTHHDWWGFITNPEWLQSKNVFCVPVQDLQSYAVYSDCFIERSLLREAHKHIQKRTQKRRCRATNTLVKIHISKHQNGYCWPVETILAICYHKNKV